MKQIRSHPSRLLGFILAAGLLYGVVLKLTADTNVPARPRSQGKIEVFPAEVQFHSKRDSQALVVRIVDPDGVTRDVSSTAAISLSDPALAKVEGRVVTPASNGKGSIKIEAEGLSASVPLEIKDAALDPAISFRRDVMPVFMRAGCNTGGCHGSARGKDGFHLSLFGYDPDGDYYRLTREMGARRVNLAIPDASLILQKATGMAPHTGGKRFDKSSELYATLLHWIQAGAPNDAPNIPSPAFAEILPKQILLAGENEKQQLTVRVRYSDGSTRDVTKLAVFFTNNDTSAKVNEAGVITAGQRGEAFVTARFDTFTVGAEVIVIPKNLQFAFPAVREANYIDTLVDNKLRRLRVAPSDLCSDEEFLRRASIDLTGELPGIEEHDRFVADAAPDKRARLIEDLLKRKEFVDLWVMKWSEILQIHSTDNVSYKSALTYFTWLEDQIVRNVPINEIVRELVASTGGTLENPASTYYQEETDPLKLAENCAQAFLGIRMQCAQCHNHPFDRWTMNDYRGFVGFFTQVGRKKGEDPRETIVYDKHEGESKHPLDDHVVAPKFLAGETPALSGTDRRQALADWLASPENPYFAKHIANIIWAQFFGRGVVEPVDDVRVSNPPANAELLDELGRKLTEYHYDYKRLIRDICNSRTYQLSSVTNETNEADSRNFSHSAIRRLRAEVMLDCITQVTDTSNKFKGLPPGASAVQIADGKETTYFLTTFGRATRETVCTCEVSMEPNLSQALHLLNGDTVSQKIAQGQVVKKLLDQKKSGEQIVENLYLRCLGRKPLESEMKNIEPLLAKNETQPKVLDDVFWALLNSKEFMFNH